MDCAPPEMDAPALHRLTIRLPDGVDADALAGHVGRFVELFLEREPELTLHARPDDGLEFIIARAGDDAVMERLRRTLSESLFGEDGADRIEVAAASPAPEHETGEESWEPAAPLALDTRSPEEADAPPPIDEPVAEAVRDAGEAPGFDDALAFPEPAALSEEETSEGPAEPAEADAVSALEDRPGTPAAPAEAEAEAEAAAEAEAEPVREPDADEADADEADAGMPAPPPAAGESVENHDGVSGEAEGPGPEAEPPAIAAPEPEAAPETALAPEPQALPEPEHDHPAEEPAMEPFPEPQAEPEAGAAEDPLAALRGEMAAIARDLGRESAEETARRVAEPLAELIDRLERHAGALPDASRFEAAAERLEAAADRIGGVSEPVQQAAIVEVVQALESLARGLAALRAETPQLRKLAGDGAPSAD